MKPKKSEKKNATIKDVAYLSGVSIGTVSRFLNGYNIKTINRRAIEVAIEELNYRTDQFARSMKTGKSATIGLMVAGYDYFSIKVLTSMVKRFREKRYSLMTHHHEDSAAIFDEAFEFFMERQFDGIALSGVDCRMEQVEEYLREGKALAIFNNNVPGLDVDRVFVNNEEASFQAVSYLIQMNHKRIGILSGLEKDSTAVERLEGYKRALRENGIDFDKTLVIQGKWKETGGYFGAKDLLKLETPPTAVFSSNYLMLMGFMKALKEMHLSVPSDISLVSFDDPDFFEIANPPITAVAQPSVEVGEQVSTMLLERVSGTFDGPGREIRLNCRLVLRDSVSFN